MTFRAVRILKEADLILAEDTRTSSVLLKHYDIKNAMQSHHKFNEHQTVEKVVERIKARGTSIWMFPEGTRSQGRGLLPFKAGAFHTAVQAEVPVVPIVCSSYFGQIDLNRWDNGEVLLEVMAPVCSKERGAAGIRELSEVCRARMEAKLAELDGKLGRHHAA